MLHAISLSIVLQLSNLAGVPQAQLAHAKDEVTRVYSVIGVPVEWRDSSGSNATHVVILPAEGGSLRLAADTVMGAAARTPQGTGVAYVYYGRVREQAARHDAAADRVLAYAIAHEIGHLLLASRAHAPDGLMRACWRRAEFRQADRGQLQFTSGEGADIRVRLGELEALVEDESGDGAGDELEQHD